MRKTTRKKSSRFAVNDVDSALRSFWSGSCSEFEQLVSENGSSEVRICSLLADIIKQPLVRPEPNERIGDYTIIREIGRGGMGVVYEAIQEQTGRTVALKVVRWWRGASEREAKLFRREVEALARLKHPNIATLYDAGHTPEGHQFFAMELIRGQTLAEHMAKVSADAGYNAARLTEHLELFRKICQAMNYAHQRGIIHCDLKPSNIVLDDRNDPKVLDFGLARLLDSDRSGKTSMSETDKIVGTLSYMSPEQSRGRLQELDTRSDVYSLGVVLFELLTGERLYGQESMSLPETIHTICEKSPRKPGAIHRHLRGDLETIMLKALEKEPDRRYQSASALAEDIERFLGNQPIFARSPSATYQLRKLISRHKLTAGLMAALFMITTVFAVVSGVQNTQITEERDKAQSEAHKSQQANEFLVRMLTYVGNEEVGPRIAVREILDKAASGIEVELADQPENRASLHETLGRSYLSLRLFEEAEVQLKSAFDIRREIFGERHPLFARSLHQMGLGNFFMGKEDLGLEYLYRAYELRRELLGEQHVDVAESLTTIADRERYQLGPAGTIPMYENALTILRKSPGEERRMADALHSYANMLVESGWYEEAVPILDETLGIRTQLLGPDHFEVARTLKDLGEIYFNWADYDKAESIYREQIRIFRSVFGENGSRDLAHALSDLAGVVRIKEDYAKAESFYQESIEMEYRTMGYSALALNDYGNFLYEQGRFAEALPHSKTVYRLWFGDSEGAHQGKGYACQKLANNLFELGHWDEAERLYGTAINNWRELYQERHPRLARGLIGLGRVKQIKGDYDEAETLFRNALQVHSARLGERAPRTAMSMVYLGEILRIQGKADAEQFLVDGVNVLREELGDQHSRVAWALAQLAELKKDEGELDEAETMMLEALEIERQLPRESHPFLADYLVGLAEILMARGDAAGAEPLLREALSIRQHRYVEDDYRIAIGQSALGSCLFMLGHSEEAEPLLSAAHTTLQTKFGDQHQVTQQAHDRLDVLNKRDDSERPIDE